MLPHSCHDEPLVAAAEAPGMRGKGASAVVHGVFDVIGPVTCSRSTQSETSARDGEMLIARKRGSA
jgi:hypothetical protein